MPGEAAATLFDPCTRKGTAPAGPRPREAQHLPMKSTFVRSADAPERWLHYDASEQNLGRMATQIAMALMRFHRAQLPAPEDIQDPGPQVRTPYAANDRQGAVGAKPWQRDRERDNRASAARPDGGFKRPDRSESSERPVSSERGPRPERPERQDMVWFRISIGREHNADPRWLLPLICRAGSVTKAEIGAIRIFDRDSRFQIAESFAESFAVSVKAAPQKQGHISRVSTKPGADDAAASGSAPHAAAPRASKPRPPKPAHFKRPDASRDAARTDSARPEGKRLEGKPPHAAKPYKPFHKKKQAS